MNSNIASNGDNTPDSQVADLSEVTTFDPAVQPSPTRKPHNNAKRRRQKKHVETHCGRIPIKVAEKLRGPDFDLELYLTYFPEITEAGKRYLREALERTSRDVGGTANVTRYASLVFGQTYTTESDQELPVAYLADGSEEILTLRAQAPKISLGYRTGASNATPWTKPDAVLFTVNGPIVVEAKMRQKLLRLCIEQSDRYKRDEATGLFYSPPLETAAKEYGFSSQLVCELNFSGKYLQNEQFLGFYRKRNLIKEITPEEKKAVFDAIDNCPGILASKVAIADVSRRGDVVHSLLATGHIYANLLDADVLNFDQLRLFRTRLEKTAFGLFRGEFRMEADCAAVPIITKFPVHGSFKLGKRHFTIESHLPNAIRVVDDKTGVQRDIPHVLLRDADIKVTLSEAEMSASQLVAQLGEDRLRIFCRNYKKIQPYLPVGRLAGCSSGDRHVRRLLRNYRAGGPRALVPRTHERGNTEDRKTELSNDLLKQAIKQNRNGKKVNATTVYLDYVILADKQSLPKKDRFSKRSVQRHIAVERCFKTALLTDGRRNALVMRPPGGRKKLLGNPNGRSPWFLGHIDHTLVDCLVWNPETEKYERPYISALVDGYDKRILAAIMWFGHPNARLVIDLLKDCLRRHGVIPMKIRCDWGSEFRSTFVQAGLASIGVSIAYRPKGEPRSGSPIETSFRTMNVKVFHQEAGNTKATKNPRGITPEIDPQYFATWVPDKFYPLMEEYIKTHNDAERTADVSPDSKYSAFVARHGVHCAQWLSPELLDRLDFEPLRHPTRVVQRNATIRINFEDYIADELEHLLGQEVRVYVDRKDPRIIHADHPKTKQRFKCRASSNAMVHCETAEDAQALAASRNGSYDRQLAADPKWAALRAKANVLRDSITPADSQPTPPPPPPPQSSNAVEPDTKLLNVPAATLVID